MKNPTVVGFPLRGEWYAPNTPGSKIPSHGTNRLGSRYAYDFIQVDWNRKGYPAYQAGLLEYLLRGVSLARYYCWGQEVYAPCNGVVVEARDGYPERPRTNLLGDLANAYQNARHFDPDKDDVQAVAGNFVIIQCAEGGLCGACSPSDRLCTSSGRAKCDQEGTNRAGRTLRQFFCPAPAFSAYGPVRLGVCTRFALCV